jgi:hypothetical protein
MKITTILLGVVMLTGCQNPATPTPPAQVQDTKQDARPPNLAEQKMCSEQAKKSFDDYTKQKVQGVKPLSQDYTSHYDPKATICYVLIEDTSMTGTGEMSTSYTVFDAFERRLFANYLWITQKGKKYWEVKPMECSVTVQGQDVKCTSDDEFKKMVTEKFGLGF